MTESTKENLIQLGIYLTLALGLILWWRFDIDTDEKVYQIVYGKVLCAHAEETRCGLTLKNCADGREYRCMQNVFSQQQD
jgi:hypothetical protein